jgi:hypothetical protein
VIDETDDAVKAAVKGLLLQRPAFVQKCNALDRRAEI